MEMFLLGFACGWMLMLIVYAIHTGILINKLFEVAQLMESNVSNSPSTGAKEVRP